MEKLPNRTAKNWLKTKSVRPNLTPNSIAQEIFSFNWILWFSLINSIKISSNCFKTSLLLEILSKNEKLKSCNKICPKFKDSIHFFFLTKWLKQSFHKQLFITQIFSFPRITVFLFPLMELWKDSQGSPILSNKTLDERISESSRILWLPMVFLPKNK